MTFELSKIVSWGRLHGEVFDLSDDDIRSV